MLLILERRIAPITNKTPNIPKQLNLKKALDELVQKGVPGVVFAVQSDEGYWATARGYAKIEGQNADATLPPSVPAKHFKNLYGDCNFEIA
jgi:hypothetical protein